jgi:hypothetical protein
LQPLRLIFQAHPAQFANALDEIIRPDLAFRGIVALWLFERHWHGLSSRIFLLLALPAVRNATFLCRSCTCRSIARRFAGANRGRSRQNVSFDLLACLRKGTAVRRNILRRKIG